MDWTGTGTWIQQDVGRGTTVAWTLPGHRTDSTSPEIPAGRTDGMGPVTSTAAFSRWACPGILAVTLALLIHRGASSTDRTVRIDEECGKTMAHTDCSHSLTDEWLAQGLDLPRDAKEAIQRYRWASSRGDSRGDCALGWMVEHGVGGAQDAVEAHARYLRSARAGNACAQYHLANMYERGALGTVYLARASRWYTEAAIQGDPDAAGRLEIVNELQTLLAENPGTDPGGSNT